MTRIRIADELRDGRFKIVRADVIHISKHYWRPFLRGIVQPFQIPLFYRGTKAGERNERNIALFSKLAEREFGTSGFYELRRCCITFLDHGFWFPFVGATEGRCGLRIGIKFSAEEGVG